MPGRGSCPSGFRGWAPTRLMRTAWARPKRSVSAPPARKPTPSRLRAMKSTEGRVCPRLGSNETGREPHFTKAGAAPAGAARATATSAHDSVFVSNPELTGGRLNPARPAIERHQAALPDVLGLVAVGGAP